MDQWHVAIHWILLKTLIQKMNRNTGKSSHWLRLLEEKTDCNNTVISNSNRSSSSKILINSAIQFSLKILSEFSRVLFTQRTVHCVPIFAIFGLNLISIYRYKMILILFCDNLSHSFRYSYMYHSVLLSIQSHYLRRQGSCPSVYCWYIWNTEIQ